MLSKQNFVAYSMIDVIPWSLIYGKQNENYSKNLNELELKYKNILNEYIDYLIENLIGCCPKDFNNINSDNWLKLLEKKNFITNDKIDEIHHKYILKHNKSIWWSMSSEIELQYKVNIIKKYFKN